jgi:NifU-like protein involved in Fe-S cluster formation
VNYSPATRAHFDAAAGAGRLDGPGVVRGAAGSAAAGTWVQFDLRIRQDAAGARTVSEARFLAFGCPHTIAAADWLVGVATGIAPAATLPEPVHALQQRLGVPVEKLGRLLTVEDAWLSAMRAALALTVV